MQQVEAFLSNGYINVLKVEVCNSDPNPNPNPIRSDRIRIGFALDLNNSDRIGSDFIVFYSGRIKLSSFDLDFVSDLLKMRFLYNINLTTKTRVLYNKLHEEN